jgi:hypothetical protein
MSRFVFADGRPNVTTPPMRAAVRAGPPQPTSVRAGPASSFHELRELTERHMRENADIRAALRRVRAARRPVQRRPTWRPPVPHARPSLSPRPRERRAAPHGRDGGARDDGSGSDGGGGGDGPSPPPSPARDAVAGGAP